MEWNRPPKVRIAALTHRNSLAPRVRLVRPALPEDWCSSASLPIELYSGFPTIGTSKPAMHSNVATLDRGAGELKHKYVPGVPSKSSDPVLRYSTIPVSALTTGGSCRSCRGMAGSSVSVSNASTITSDLV